MMIAILLALAGPHSVQHRPHEDSISVEQQVKVYQLARQVCPNHAAYNAARKQLRMADQLLLGSMCRLYLQGRIDVVDDLEKVR